jgi:hypothetical protein
MQIINIIHFFIETNFFNRLHKFIDILQIKANN